MHTVFVDVYNSIIFILNSNTNEEKHEKWHTSWTWYVFFIYSKDGEKKITQMLVYHRNEEEEAE